MLESRRAGLSGGKGPPLASAKRGPFPPGPPSSPKRALLQEMGSRTAFSGGITTSFGGVLSVGGAVCGPLDAKESGRGWLRAKKIFRRRQARTGGTPPSPVMSAPWRSRGMSCPSPEDGDPPYRPEEKFLGGAGEHEGERRPFSKKVSSPPHQKNTAPGQRWRASCARRPWP